MEKRLTQVEHAHRLARKLNRQMIMASEAIWAMQNTVDEIESRFGSAFSDKIQQPLNECCKGLTKIQEFNNSKKLFGI